jgi:uncharacterized protein (UPF0332 family)
MFLKGISNHTEILCWSRNSGPLFSFGPNSCARSRKSGHGVLDRKERKCVFQIIWKMYFEYNERKCKFQKFWNRYFWSYRNLCWSRNSGPLFSFRPNSCARSRKSGNGVLDRKERKCVFQIIWKMYSDHNERKCKFQKFWNRYFWSYRNSVLSSSSRKQTMNDEMTTDEMTTDDSTSICNVTFIWTIIRISYKMVQERFCFLCV